MAIVSRAQLKKWFQTKAYPTAEQFAAWIDSYFHKGEDKFSIDDVDGLAEQFNGKYPATSGKELEKQVAGIDAGLTDLKTATDTQFAQIADEQDAQDAEIEALRVRAHFRGYLATNAAIRALTEPIEGDYAYSAESGTKWLYDEIAAMWSDTGLAVPDQTVPPSDDLPLPDGIATPGKGTSYSRQDHVHPTDPTRAAVADLKNKRDLMSTPGRVYVIDGAGAQTGMPYSQTATPNYFAIRDANGGLIVPATVDLAQNEAIGAKQADNTFVKINGALIDFFLTETNYQFVRVKTSFGEIGFSHTSGLLTLTNNLADTIGVSIMGNRMYASTASVIASAATDCPPGQTTELAFPNANTQSAIIYIMMYNKGNGKLVAEIMGAYYNNGKAYAMKGYDYMAQEVVEL